MFKIPLNPPLKRGNFLRGNFMRDRIHLTFPKERIAEPVMCNVAKKFDVVYSIRRANVEAGAGWMDLEFTGDDDEIDRVIAYLLEQGLRVDPIEGDIVAG